MAYSADAVAAGALLLEQTFVGALDEIGGRLVTFFEGGDADADRDPDLIVLEHEAVLLDLLADAVGERRRAGEIGLGQDDGELFAAVAREDLVAADAPLHHARELLQHEVAGE